ncbi:MAG: hypothetical protein QM804_13460 [Propionicimonas sp.]
MRKFLHHLIGVLASPAPRRDEAGLSQSTENAVLLIGAVTVASAVVGAIKLFVEAKLPHP